MIVLTVLSSAFLVACGDKDEVTNAPENAPTEQENNNGSTTNSTTPKDAPFSFTKFSLDVDYEGNKSFDVDYDNEPKEVEASYEDERNNENIHGNDAYTKLEPIFKAFTFDIDTPDDEVLAEVKEAFNVGEDYRDFELEVRFADGTTKEYREIK